MYFSCGEGTIIAEYYSNKLQVKYLGEKELETIDFSGAGGHGGGDVVIADSLREAMLQDKRPRTGAAEGLHSTVVALSIDSAMRDGRVFDLDPIWRTLANEEAS